MLNAGQNNLAQMFWVKLILTILCYCHRISSAYSHEISFLACMSIVFPSNACLSMPAAALACVCVHFFAPTVSRWATISRRRHFSPADVTFQMREEETGRELRRQIWKSMSRFLWCASKSAAHHATHAMAVAPLIDGFSYCRPLCVWSFNKVCFYTQRPGWMQQWLMLCVLLQSKQCRVGLLASAHLLKWI